MKVYQPTFILTCQIFIYLRTHNVMLTWQEDHNNEWKNTEIKRSPRESIIQALCLALAADKGRNILGPTKITMNKKCDVQAVRVILWLIMFWDCGLFVVVN